jgi:hypothetical protein
VTWEVAGSFPLMTCRFDDDERWSVELIEELRNLRNAAHGLLPGQGLLVRERRIDRLGVCTLNDPPL